MRACRRASGGGCVASAPGELRAVRVLRLVLLGGGKRGLLDFAVSLPGRMTICTRAVDEVAASLARRCVGSTPPPFARALRDAYEGAGGRQSASIVLLDAGRSSMHGSRLRPDLMSRSYDHGRPSGGFSPEEEDGGGRGHGWVTRQLRPSPHAAGSGVGRELRAAGDIRAACPRARIQGKGRGDRGARPAAPSSQPTPILGRT